ncbi:hypothetical protein M8J76_001664 [Diaphorina citri]|nr:hypothetical protein M8J76_001664 [Diaphorina citri]
MDLSEPEEPTCVLKMLSEFNRNVEVPNFPFVFERFGNVSQESSNNKPESDLSSVKKRRVEPHDSTLDSDMSISENIPASPWESNKLRRELIEAKTEIKNLEYRYHELLNIKKSSDILYEKDREAFKYAEEKQTRKIRDLEKHLKQMRARATKLEEELSDMKATAPGAIAELEGEQHALQVQKTILNGRLEEDLRMERTNYKLLEEEWKARLSSLESEKELCDTTVEKLRAELKEKTVQLQKQEMYKTKLMVAQQKVQELQMEADNNRETVKQMAGMQSKLLHYGEVLKENETLNKQVTNLRELISNNLLLEGQLEELKMQQKKAEENQTELIKLKTDFAEVENERLLIVDMRDLIEKSQRSILELNYQKKEIQQDLQAAKEKITSLTSHLESASAKEAKTKNLLEAHASTIRRLKKQNNLVTWERNDLRQMLDSVQKEVTLIGNATFSESAAPPGSDRAKLEVLEKVIEGYRQRMEHIEADQGLVCVIPDQAGSPNHPDIKKLTSERDDLLREKEELLKREKELKEKVDHLTYQMEWRALKERDELLREKELKEKVDHLTYQMEWRALKGDFDIRETKVLRLKLGPHETESTSSASTLDQLKIENDKLKEKIKILKDQIQSGSDASKLQDVTVLAESNVNAVASKQVEELNNKIKSLELQGKRLREVYKAASQEFRETVYLLFGYKVDRTNCMYKLASMYADGPDENLLFQSTEGQLNLIETDYSKVLKPLLDLHLGRHHSIPMLLSALTQELFQRQTMSMTNSTLSV